jgi:hypothetical protein
MKENAIWQNWLNLIIGAWVFVIPWTVSHGPPSSGMSGAMWNFWLVGSIVFISSALAIQNIKPWEEWVNLTAGVWLLISPWIFGYQTQTGLLWNALIAGAVVSALSGLALPVAVRIEGQGTKSVA